MKNKKIIIGLVILVIALSIALVLLIIKNNSTNRNKAKVALAAYEVANEKTTGKELPDFTLRIMGLIHTDVNKKVLDLNSVNLLEFDAGVSTAWGVKTSHFVGYKLSDILKILKMPSYKTISFMKSGGMELIYPKEVVDKDKIYIVFYKDGNKVENGKYGVLSVSDDGSYSADNIYAMHIK